MTPERKAEILRDQQRGVWGMVERSHRTPPALGALRLWLGKDDRDFVYSAWVDMDAERASQLISRAGHVADLLVALEEAEAETARAVARAEKAEASLEGAKRWAGQLRERIARGNDIAQRREAELEAEIAALRVKAQVQGAMWALMTEAVPRYEDDDLRGFAERLCAEARAEERLADE